MTPPPPPLALRAAMRARYATTFVERLDDGHRAGRARAPDRVARARVRARVRPPSTRTSRARGEGRRREDGGAAGGRDANANANANEDEEATTTFGDFAYGRWARTLGVKSLVEKHAWEVMCNAEAARKSKTSECAELFCAFVAAGVRRRGAALLFVLSEVVEVRVRVDGDTRGAGDANGRFRTRESGRKGARITSMRGVHACDVSLDAKTSDDGGAFDFLRRHERRGEARRVVFIRHRVCDD